MKFRAHGGCSVTGLEGLKDLKGLSFSSLSPKPSVNGKIATRTNKAKVVTKPSP